MAQIEITDVRIYPFNTTLAGGKTLAMAQITIGGALVIRGFRIIESKGGGIFVTFPSHMGKDGKWHDIVSPANAEVKELVRHTIVEAYREYPDPGSDDDGQLA